MIFPTTISIRAKGAINNIDPAGREGRGGNNLEAGMGGIAGTGTKPVTLQRLNAVLLTRRTASSLTFQTNDRANEQERSTRSIWQTRTQST